ncbi:MAG: two-component system sensor histidine kinase CreC [Gammaproteobacteria bacterium]|nr:two-component system sensor histidine kinase CreC [Gammaproteobacteria bacterium]
MKIRNRVLLVLIVALGVALYLLLRWVSDDLHSRYNESLEEPLVDTANILATMIGNDALDSGNRITLREKFDAVARRRFTAQIYDLQRDRVDMRVYVTDHNGIVVFDSDPNGAEGQDYSAWNDVMLTLRGEYGARSSPVGSSGNKSETIAYVAAPVLENGKIMGVVSVGKPKQYVKQFLAAARLNLLIAGGIAGLIALALALALYRWVSLPLDRLAAYALAVRDGRRSEPPTLGNNEIGEVGAAMEAMRIALDGKDYIERYTQALTHELKSPLTAIRGAVELLDEPMPDPERQRFKAVIKQETHRLHELIERILDLAALENRTGLENVEQIAVDELIKDAIAGLEPSITAKGIIVNSRGDSAAYIVGERFLLRQAIVNLLQNALQQAPDNSEVTIDCTAESGQINIRIRDHGPGIPEFAVDKVFNRFFSYSAADVTHKGSGLGLNLVREVAALHGGTATLSNMEDGGGALATISIPAQTSGNFARPSQAPQSSLT